MTGQSAVAPDRWNGRLLRQATGAAAKHTRCLVPTPAVRRDRRPTASGVGLIVAERFHDLPEALRCHLAHLQAMGPFLDHDAPHLRIEAVMCTASPCQHL